MKEQEQIQEVLLSNSPVNQGLRSLLKKNVDFISYQDRDARGLNGLVNRFGFLSSLVKRVPIHIFDHPELCEQFETAFTDGRSVYINANFMKALRADEIDTNGYNITPVVLHELLHFAFKHTQRKSLNQMLKTPLDHYLMNIAMDSIINGIIYDFYSIHGQNAKDKFNRRHLMKIGRAFLTTAVGFRSKEIEDAYGNPEKAKEVVNVLMEKYAKTDSENIKNNVSNMPAEDKEKLKDINEKIKNAMEKVFKFLDWKNTKGMSEYEVYYKIKEMLEQDKDFNEAQEELSKLSKMEGDGSPQKGKGGMSSPLSDALKGALGEMGEDFESGEHIVSPEELKEALEEAGLSEEEIEALGLPGNEKEQKESDSKATDIVDSSAHEASKQDGSASTGQGTGNLPSFFKERIKERNQGLLDYSGELNAMMDYVVGQSRKLTVDVSCPSVEYYLDHEDLGLNMPVWEDDRMPSSSTGVVMVLLDTSGSVDNALMSQFAGDVVTMAEYLIPRGGKVVVCSADVDIKKEDIVEITEESFNEIRRNGLPIAGRGGTCFERSLIEAGQLIESEYNALKLNDKKEEVAALIYLTDGEDHAPSMLPHASLPNNIQFIVPEAQVSRIDSQVNGYANVLPLKEGVTLEFDIETNDEIEDLMELDR